MATSPTVEKGSFPLLITPRLLAANEKRPEGAKMDYEELIGKIVTGAHLRKARYASRNDGIYMRRKWFAGDHWLGTGTEESEDRDSMLVFNYVRNIVLRFAAIMVRHPRPKVPIPIEGSPDLKRKANNRERFLLSLWPTLKRAWRDVELNASKCGIGVMQILWDPPEAENVDIGEGELKDIKKRYLDPPYRFRSIKPENFYPVYRTYEKPDDFMWVYHIEPNRLVADLEQKYDVILQPSGLATDMDGSALGTQPTCEVVAYWDKKIYALIAITHVLDVQGDPSGRDRGRAEARWVENYALLEYTDDHELGKIPFWVLQNIRDPDADPTDGGSISDTDDITALNRHYNWIVSEESDEIVTHIHRPTFYSSEEHMQDPGLMTFKPGAVIPIGDEEEVFTLDWQPEPGFVGGHLDRIELAIKELSFLSEAGFGKVPAGVSGMAAKVAMTPLEQITELKLPQRQDLLQDVCKYLLRLFEKFVPKDVKFEGYVSAEMGKFGQVTFSKNDVLGQYAVVVDYKNMIPRDDVAYEQNETYKYKTGTQSLTRTLDRMGEDDPESEKLLIKAELMDPELNPDHVVRVMEAKRMQREEEQQQMMMEMQKKQQEGGGGMGMGMGEGMGAGQGMEMPGSAQPGTRPVQPGAPTGGAQTAPPIPGAEAFGAGGGGAGQAAPFMGRKMAGEMPLPGQTS